MKYKVVCFDLDGTIIDDIEYIWYVLHEYFNINMEYVKKWHKMFDDGKVNYEEWFNEDIKWWNEAGATKEGFFEVVKKLKLMEGAVDTIRELKKNGVKIAIISGSCFNIASLTSLTLCFAICEVPTIIISFELI